MSIEKLTAKLAEHIQKTGVGDMLDVIVELDPARGQDILSQSGDLSRQDRIARLQEDFTEQSAAVISKIAEAGGEILDHAWVNKTLKVRLPAESLGEIAQEAEVKAVDLPEILHPETEEKL
jgi:hypothetical protein